MPARPLQLTTRRRTRGMSLIEVMIALGVLAITLAGVLAALVQSRRLTEGSLAQNSALTIVQGYMEQIKNMEIAQIANFDANGNAQLGSSFTLPTLIDQNTPDSLQTSVGTPPALGSFTGGTTPSGLGIVDNLKDYDLVKDSTALTMNATDNSTTATTTQVAWNAIWPNALNFPLTTGGAVATAGKSDLHINIWVWITDLNSGTSAQSASVRLINGTVPAGQSLIPSGASTIAGNPNGDGFTLATNAPLYIKGNFNADGSGTGSPTLPDDGNDGSAAHPTVESPACLAADAITILSPGFSDATSYSSTKPNSTASVEIAAAFLTGLTPTSNTANSGGAHNLPRFLETWSSPNGTVTIRGSLVTMYQSKIATQPFSTNWYGAPTRAWGFDSNFQNGNFPPITPRVISFRRVDFNDLSPAAYTALRHSLWPSEY